MSKCTLTVNGRDIQANVGETLLEAALRGRVVIPQDCCTGQCNTCRVKVHAGAVDDQGTAVNDTCLGCTATLLGSAVISFDEVPALVKRAGVIEAIRPISPEIFEVRVRVATPLDYLPGQYVNLAFNGYPGRDYSPTVFENGTFDPHVMVFQIKRYEGGLISTAIGNKINVGHKVTVKGPYGHAFYREGEGRLVLVASGTGWAPIWAVAREAKLRDPMRDIVLVVGARHAANLYMGNSLLWLAERGVRTMSVCASGLGFGGVVKKGRPTDFMPALRSDDVVYAAGVPSMVNAVAKLAEAAGAECYMDAFTMSSTGLSVINRIQQAMSGTNKTPLSPRVEGAIYTGGQRKTAPTYQPTTSRPRQEERDRMAR
jgi:NAD(P)H-flavin reductase/ferredoxin